MKTFVVLYFALSLSLSRYQFKQRFANMTSFQDTKYSLNMSFSNGIYFDQNGDMTIYIYSQLVGMMHRSIVNEKQMEDC